MTIFKQYLSIPTPRTDLRMERNTLSAENEGEMIPVQRLVSTGRGRLDTAFLQPNVHLRNLPDVASRLKKMSMDGPEKFQIISDFDMTLTQYHVNGCRGCSSHAIAEQSPILGDGYMKKAVALRDKYYPLEISGALSTEDKLSLMVEWWSKAHTLLMEYGLKESHLEAMIKTACIELRPGCSLLFETANKFEVPLLIFSAGLSNMIAEVVRMKSVLHPNIRVLANDMFFDEDELVGFSEPLVHSFNKSQIATHHRQVFQEVKDRSNVLLMGDSTGDPHMADAFKAEHQLNIVKVGFLNYREEELLPKYLELYDIVLTGDASMDVVNSIVVYILDQLAHIQ